jgi:hypothetical protein
MTRALLGVAALALAAHAVTSAQTPDFSGTWKLDADRSRIAAATRFAGLAAAGVPDILYVTDAANGTLILESRINESHARLYTPGGKSSTPVTVGPGGSVTMTSRREGRTVISEGLQEIASGTSTIVNQIKEVLALSADGRTLTIEIATTGAGDTHTSTLVYTKTHAVEPCQAWPTPCKRASGQ